MYKLLTINDNKSINSQAIDIVKFICAILVVIIHANPFGEYPLIDKGVGVITRIAVPFFFVSSSFFLFRKPNLCYKILFKYILRIFILYTVWTIIYLFNNSIKNDFETTNFLLNFFVVGYGHLWFLQSIIIASFIVFLLRNKKIILIFLSVILYICGLVFFTYFPYFSNISLLSSIKSSMFFSLIDETGFLFYGIPYVTIGLLSTQYRLNFKPALILTITFWILLTIEGVFGFYVVHAERTILWFNMLPLSFAFFSLVSNFKIKIKKSTIVFRKLSISIYVVHPLFISIVSRYILNNILLFVIVLTSSVIFSFCIYFISKIKCMKFLSYIV